VCFSGLLPGGLALAIVLIAGCGRIGYEPVALVLDRDGGVDGPVGNLPEDRDVAAADVPATDSGADQLPDVPDAPPVADLRPDTSADLPPPPPPDGAPDAGPTGVNGTATCFDYPARRDLIADFEDATLVLTMVDGRGGAPFHLVQTGAGVVSVASVVPPLGACGSSLLMFLRAENIPAGRNAHIQALFIAGPAGTNRDYDARAFWGVRLSLRASRPMSVSLKITDGATVASLPYDHFSISLNVTTSWRTYVVPFASLRQAGNGTPRPALDLARLVGIELQSTDRTFDLFVDTIAFTR
jgi:Carbohydrate binding domain (family 11)